MLSARNFLFLLLFAAATFALPATAQSGGNSTSVAGTVLDQTGAVVPNATVQLHNSVSQFTGTATTDSNGNFAVPKFCLNSAAHRLCSTKCTRSSALAGCIKPASKPRKGLTYNG